MTTAARPVAFLLCLLLASGCSRGPRSREVILREREKLPTLFLTLKTGQRVIGPGDKVVFLDRGTNELCWRAQQCNNPNCPGRKNGEPFLFISPDHGFFPRPDGTLGYDPEKAALDPGIPGCPKCYKIRNIGRESVDEQARYNSFVQPYDLPESAAQRQRLEEELRRLVELEKAKKK